VRAFPLSPVGTNGVVGDVLEAHCNYHQGHAPNEYRHLPVIVPPTWKLRPLNYVLRRIWVKAHAKLSHASRVVIVGHSLPVTDSYLRYFLALSLTRRRQNKVMIVNSDRENLDRYACFLESHLPGRVTRKESRFQDRVPDILEFVSN
jgi:hypothetical protein